MYDVIDTKRGVRKTYTEALIGRGDISMKEAEDALRDYQGQLERVFNEVRELEKHAVEPSESVEADQMIPAGMATAVEKALLARIGDAHLAFPEGFTVHPRVKPVLDKRREMAYEGKVDWAFAELLALGSLLAEGKMIRLSGQDTRRGTFTQRHSVIIDRKTGAEFTPLQLLTTNRTARRPAASSWCTTRRCRSSRRSASSTATRSATRTHWCCGRPSSATSSTARSRSSTSSSRSGEAKWGQLSDVVLLLPHGHEGQGPDHTSGRIERFLQLCAEGSMTIAVPSTPANYFHLLRRHAPGRHPPADDRVHAEVDAAQQGRGQRHPGLHRAEVPVGARGAHLQRGRPATAARYANPVDQRQDLLRAGRRARPRISATTWRSCGSSSWPRCRGGGWPRRWTSIRTPSSTSGCRRSRRTRAPGRRSA